MVFMLAGASLVVYERFALNQENSYWWVHLLAALLIGWAFAAHGFGFKGPLDWRSHSGN
jgi:hypothetical protein